MTSSPYTQSAAQANAGFAERIFAAAHQHLRKLAIGDIRANLEERCRVSTCKARALAASEAKATQLAEGLAHAPTALDLFLAREKGAASAEDARPQMLLSSVRLGDAQKARLEDLFSTCGIQKKLVEVGRGPPRSSRAAPWSHLDDPHEPHGEAAHARATEACAASLAATRLLAQERVPRFW